MDKTTPIYFICPDNKEPIGGIKQLYRQVDILNNNGFNAAIIHKRKLFRHNWFENNTKIIYGRFIFDEIDKLTGRKSKVFKSYFRKSVNNLDPNGILIIPELHGSKICNLLKGMRKVVFNQNCYYTFKSFDVNTFDNKIIYNNADLLGVIVVSEDSKKYLKLAFEDLNILRIKLGINSTKFFYNDSIKKKQIAFMPRKLSDEIGQVINILKYRNKIKDWNFIPIDNKNENEVAQILNESRIFLSFNHKEGFGLPPAEAMSSGCLVIGYTGEGGEEYFLEDFSFKIPKGNIIQYIETIEKAVNEYDNTPESFTKKQEMASNYIKNNYNLESENESVISCWNSLLQIKK